MNIIKVSATQARNQFFDLLNHVIYDDAKVLITKAGVSGRKVFLTAEDQTESNDQKRKKFIQEIYGIFKHIPKKAFTDDRLRGKRARQYLRSLRQGNV